MIFAVSSIFVNIPPLRYNKIILEEVFKMTVPKEITYIAPKEKHDKHIRVEQKMLNVAAY